MRLALLATALLLSSACAPADAPLDTDDQKASYGIGYNIGTQLAPGGELLDRGAFVRGLEDALEDVDPAIDPAELQQLVRDFSGRVDERIQAQRTADAEANREAGAAYLAENGARPEVTTTESGLQYEVLTEGEGARPGPGDQVRVHYRGTLTDGTEFDSSYSRGEPSVFGVGGVIPGFSEGLQLMETGSTYRFVIPSDIAYGPRGAGSDIGPDATLIFEVELLEILGG
jgi:FKBP-type peptidyl-prolyl cis-trans isomerase